MRGSQGFESFVDKHYFLVLPYYGFTAPPGKPVITANDAELLPARAFVVRWE